MRCMFCDATNFNQKFGQNWDTRNVIYMDYMFYGIDSLNVENIPTWYKERVSK